MFVIYAYEMVQAVLVRLKLIKGRKLMGQRTSMKFRVRGKGRVPGGAVLGIDSRTCLHITAQFAVVLAFFKRLHGRLQHHPGKQSFSLVNEKYEPT